MATMSAIRRFWPNHRLIWPLTFGFGFRARWREHYQRCSGEICESLDSARAIIGRAIMTAVEEPGPDFSQIAGSDWPTAQHTRRLLAGRPAIYQYEPHV